MEISTAESENIVAQGLADAERLGVEGHLDGTIRQIVEGTIDRVEAALQERHDAEMENAADQARRAADPGISLQVSPEAMSRLFAAWAHREKLDADGREIRLKYLAEVVNPVIEHLGAMFGDWLKGPKPPGPNGRDHDAADG
jgi:hypothetical protein